MTGMKNLGFAAIVMVFLGFGMIMGGSGSGNKPIEMTGIAFLGFGCIYLILKLSGKLKAK